MFKGELSRFQPRLVYVDARNRILAERATIPCKIRLTPADGRSFRKMAEVHETWALELFGGMDDKQRDRFYGPLAEMKSSAFRAARARSA